MNNDAVLCSDTTSPPAPGQFASAVALSSPLPAAAGPVTLHDWKLWTILMIVMALIYGSLYGRRWNMGSGDDAYYLSIARNLATGHGYTWNSGPVLLVPPGWPVMLAGAMRISPQFAFLNLLPIGLCLGGIAVWFWVLRQFTSGRRAMAIMFVIGTLFQFQRFAVHHFSESPFCLLLGICLLLSFWIHAGRRPGWCIAGLCLAAAALETIRWAGVLVVPVVVGALLSGQVRPRLNRHWIAAVLFVVAIVGTFAGERWQLKRMATKDADNPEMVVGVEQALAQEVQRDARLGRFPDYARRASRGGEWISRLLWPPAEMLSTWRGLVAVSDIVGWGLLLGGAVFVWQRTRRQQWLWTGVTVTFAGTVILWGHPLGRYIVPIAPLLLLGLWEGSEEFGAWLTTRASFFARWMPTARRLAVASILAVNLPLLGITIWLTHSRNFAGQYLAGEYAQFNGIGEYLLNHRVGDKQIAVNAGYPTFNKQVTEIFVQRTVSVLTGTQSQIVPIKVCNARPSDLTPDRLARAAAWMRKSGVRYYVYRPETVPWRIWHFRLDWLQKLMKGRAADRDAPYIELYEIDGTGFHRVKTPPSPRAIERVPAL